MAPRAGVEMTPVPAGQEQPECWICTEPANEELGPLIYPCRCRGSLEGVHAPCVERWVNERWKQRAKNRAASSRPRAFSDGSFLDSGVSGGRVSSTAWARSSGSGRAGWSATSSPSPPRTPSRRAGGDRDQDSRGGATLSSQGEDGGDIFSGRADAEAGGGGVQSPTRAPEEQLSTQQCATELDELFQSPSDKRSLFFGHEQDISGSAEACCPVCKHPYVGSRRTPGLVSFGRKVCIQFMLRAFRSLVMGGALLLFWACQKGLFKEKWAQRIVLVGFYVFMIVRSALFVCLIDGHPGLSSCKDEYGCLQLNLPALVGETGALSTVITMWYLLGELQFSWYLPTILLFILPLLRALQTNREYCFREIKKVARSVRRRLKGQGYGSVLLFFDLRKGYVHISVAAMALFVPRVWGFHAFNCLLLAHSSVLLGVFMSGFGRHELSWLYALNAASRRGFLRGRSSTHV